jgi:exodeoxyribonuclease VII small subunit
MAKTVTKKKADGEAEQQPKFEEALARLEEIVELLDDGNLPLDESLALFKEGTKLAKACRDLLAEAEVQVKEALRDVESPGEDESEAR